MRHRSPHVLACASLAITLVAIGAASLGCEQLAPAPKPKEPQPGYYTSIPFADVRELSDVLVLKPGLAYAVGSDGTILKGVGNVDKKGKPAPGFTWSRESTGVTADLEAIAGFLIDPDQETEQEVMLVVGHDGTVLERDTTTTPPSWKQLDLPAAKVTCAGGANVGNVCTADTADVDCAGAPCAAPILFGVAMRSRTDAFIVGEGGTILRYVGTPDANGGVAGALVDQTSFTLQTVFGLACPTDGSGCGANNACLTDPSDGVQKCASSFPLPEALKGVGYEGSTVRAVGSRGAIYAFDADNTDPQQRWTREDSGTTRNLATIFTENGTYVPATDGVILQRNGDGSYDDQALVTPAPVFLQDVWVDQGSVFAVGFSQEIFRNEGGAWTLATVGEDAEMRGIDGFEAPPDNDPEGGAIATFLAVGGGGRIARGPFVLPAKGEVAMPTRIGDADFITP